MKIHAIALAAATLLSSATSTHAQGIAEQLKYGVDATLHLPVGDASDTAGLGLGALFRAEYPWKDRLTLTGRAGYVRHLENNGATWSWVPVLAGVKYALSSSCHLVGELGFVHLSVSVDTARFGSVSDSDLNLGLTMGGGCQVGAVDLRGGLHILDLGHADDSMTLGVSVGFNFGER